MHRRIHTVENSFVCQNVCKITMIMNGFVHMIFTMREEPMHYMGIIFGFPLINFKL